MELPAILNGALAPIDPPIVVPRSAVPKSTMRHVEFAMQKQEQSNWCWAAVAVSVSHFFDVESLWEQCSLVNAALAQKTCCANGATRTCNRPWYLDRALRRTSNIHTWRSGSMSFADLAEQLAHGSPVGVRIGWKGGGGHFVVVGKCSDREDRQFVVAHDPWSGTSTCEYQEFKNNYKGSGRWTHTYLTKQA